MPKVITATMATVPHSHQRSPALRITPYSNATVSAVMTKDTASIVSCSPNQAPKVWVAMP